MHWHITDMGGHTSGSNFTGNKVAMMPSLPSLVAPEVVVMTNYSAGSDDKVGIITTLSFQLLLPTSMAVTDVSHQLSS